jgi:hypothetical protein
LVISTKEVAMILKNIIVSKESFESNDYYDIIYSNILYINRLFQYQISDEYILEDALKSYHIDSYFAQIKYGGFENFYEVFNKKEKILYYIQEGLKEIGATDNLELFETYSKCKNYKKMDRQFKSLQKRESILKLNYHWLKSHPKILPLQKDEIFMNLPSILQYAREEKRHLKIIKKLCEISNQHYLRITAGDANNPYQNAWYFKTTKGYFYMIEKDGEASMYNSYTKEKISKVIIRERKEKNSFFSKFLKVSNY